MHTHTLLCQIRKELVSATPEEQVRQNLIACMVQELGYPAPYIALEKTLKQMPHLTLIDNNVPKRRADIICYAKGIHPQHELYPLLLVECKATLLKPKVINQVLGYNHFLRSYFVAIANQLEVKTGWYDPALQRYKFVDGLLSYDELLQALQINPSEKPRRQ